MCCLAYPNFNQYSDQKIRVSDFCPLKSNFQPQTHKTIVFKPGPVQGSGSGSPGFERVTRVNPYFIKKNQNDVILVKKKKSQRVATGFFTRFCRVTPGHDFSYFFFNPAWFQSRVSKLCLKHTLITTFNSFLTSKSTKK